jgi:hypothetical protein
VILFKYYSSTPITLGIQRAFSIANLLDLQALFQDLASFHCSTVEASCQKWLLQLSRSSTCLQEASRRRPLQNHDPAQGTLLGPCILSPTNKSVSILLISPSNQILLLHRVRTSSSFPSAHVFPGGNLSPSQDGNIPSPTDPRRHIDGPEYRLGAIRECFEESGILLAKKNDGSGAILEVPEDVREKARKNIHSGKVRFADWVKEQGGVVDSGMFIQW